jgi:cell division septum initiation protein DivIVA
MPQKLSDDLISAAIEGFEAQKRRLDEQIQELRAMLPRNGASAESAPGRGPRKRRRMSAEARRRIAEAQRKRWAAIRGESGTAPARQAQKPKRKLSPAGRKRIVEANRKRWAAARGTAVKSAGA